MTTDRSDPARATPAVPQHTATTLRRSVLQSVPLVVVAIVVASIVGHPLGGVLAAVGVGLGVASSVGVQRSVVRYAGTATGPARQAFIGNSLSRLGLVTVVVVALAFFIRPDGVGALAGVAIFQILMVGNASLPLIKELRKA